MKNHPQFFVVIPLFWALAGGGGRSSECTAVGSPKEQTVEKFNEPQNMKKLRFNADGMDTTTFAPFILQNALATEWRDVRLEFSDWNWLRAHYGDTVDGFYLNGYGIEGLVKAARFTHGLRVESESIHYNSEGNTCYIHFESLDDATATAGLCESMMSSLESLKQMIVVADANGWSDG